MKEDRDIRSIDEEEWVEMLVAGRGFELWEAENRKRPSEEEDEEWREQEDEEWREEEDEE